MIPLNNNPLRGPRTLPTRIAVNSITKAVSTVPVKHCHEHFNKHEPPKPDDGFHVYRTQCSACAGIFATLTSHNVIPADSHFDWWHQSRTAFEEHHRVDQCGGEMTITLDGKAFAIPENVLSGVWPRKAIRLTGEPYAPTDGGA